MSTDPQNSATNASGTGPATGYILHLILVMFCLLEFCELGMIVCINLDMSSRVFNMALSFSLITYVMFFYMNLWIKIYRKIILISSIQKPDFSTFSATGFAAALKPIVFYGTNYKRWRAKMILWLTAMNVYHVALG